MASDIERLTIIEKKAAVFRSILVTSVIALILLVGLGYGGYRGYSILLDRQNEQQAIQIQENIKNSESIKIEKEKANIELIKKELDKVKSKGDVANFGAFSMTLLDSKLIKDIQPDKEAPSIDMGNGGRLLDDRYYKKVTRHAVGLKFKFQNNSDSTQTWHRSTMGGLSTTQFPHQIVEDFPLNTELISATGDPITTGDVEIRSKEEFIGWLVVEVPASVSDPVYVYSPVDGLEGLWNFKW